jgi:DNA polymerase-3 subunit beta
MKIEVEKKEFLKCWNMVKECTNQKNSISIFGCVLLNAKKDSVELRASDIQNSIMCVGGGVTVDEPGEAVFQTKYLTDLFAKAPSETFSLEVGDNFTAVMRAGDSRYRFSTYPPTEFPQLPASSGGVPFCSVTVKELLSALRKGSLTMSASGKDVYPAYLSAVCLELRDEGFKIMSTDKRNIAACEAEASDLGDPARFMINNSGVVNLRKFLSSMHTDSTVQIFHDDSEVFFVTDPADLAVRKLSDKFPDVEPYLSTEKDVFVEIDKKALISALDRIEIVTSDHSGIVVMRGEKDKLSLFGRGIFFGNVKEFVPAYFSGGFKFTANARLLHNAFHEVDEDAVILSIDRFDHLSIKGKGSDKFQYISAGSAPDKEDAEASELEEGERAQ